MTDTGLLRSFSENPAAFFVNGFTTVLREKMQGLPILAPHLTVQALPFVRVGSHWLGVVATPWSVVAVCACGNRSQWTSRSAGAAYPVDLPGGRFTFLATADDVLGGALLCSLKSPVRDFADDTAAAAFARTCLTLMTTPVKAETVNGSRRAFLTGNLKGCRHV